MIAYPSGQEPDFWDPMPSEHGHRFALGNLSRASIATPPLIVIGMNPSRAREDRSDRTVNRIIAASEHHGYAGWLMLNLYPERSPKPSALGPFDQSLADANKQAIGNLLTQFAASEVLGAWGNLPHPTLRRAWQDVLSMLAVRGVRVFTFDPLTKSGYPRHPNPQGGYLEMVGPKSYL